MKIYKITVRLLFVLPILFMLGCEDKGTTTVKVIKNQEKEKIGDSTKNVHPTGVIETHGEKDISSSTMPISNSDKMPHPMPAQNSKGIIHSGKVMDLLPAAPYIYLKIKEGDKEYWIAAPEVDVKKGSEVSFEEQMWMENFTSKSLNRKFDSVMFASALRLKGVTNDISVKTDTLPTEKKSLDSSSKPSSPLVVDKDTKLYTVEELYKKADDLNNTIITLKGKVVKALEGIMGRNWIHIQDGTGTSGTNDIVFTSPDEIVSVGDEVIATGTLKTDIDFGYGYSYEVIVEKSKFKK